MKDMKIQSIIKKINRRKIILGISLLVIIAAGYLGFIRYFYNFALGPFDLEQAKLLEAEKARDFFQYFVNIQGDEIYDTGFQYVTVHDSGYEEVDYYYYALEIGRNYLLVESPDVLEDPNITGYIKSISSDIQEEMLDELIRDEPSLQDHFLPFMLKTNNFRTGGWVWIGISFVLGAISGLLLIVAFVQISNPAAHPVMKNLKHFGDPKRIASEIDSELANSTMPSKNLSFTENWLLYTKGMQFSATRYEDIIWLYKKVTQHRTNGIPTGKTYSALVYDQHGTIFTLPGKEQQVDELLMSIANRAPWAIRGYSDQLFKLYRKDRSAFMQEIKKRKNA